MPFRILCLFVLFLFFLSEENGIASEELLVFAGAASKPPAEKVAEIFQRKTGIKVNLSFGGSGFVLSQMAIAKKGDVYFPGSSDFMEIAKKKNLVFPETEKRVVYLVPAINVQKGNPKNIKSLKDLTKKGIRIAIASPESVCVGLYAVEIIEKNMNKEEKNALKKNLINYTESCEKTATAVSLKAVDAVIGWSVFQYWDPERIETVPLKKEEILRIGYIPLAVSPFTKNRKNAERFIDFLSSKEGKEIFKSFNYFVNPEEAWAFVGGKKPIGGEYILPPGWKAMGCFDG
ncbi:MAG: molybdate ABC transporter substrate-binding protein [Syntrophorhabdaceae bacterium]|nr:molybdate ABC transporter substrate-binding protein [Syntrophorhabdaceae bacterium]